jgi:hypothetical protein
VARATRLELAQAAYTAYGEATGGLNVRGEPLPEWDGLGDVIQYAWLTAAEAVETTLLNPQKHNPTNS